MSSIHFGFRIALAMTLLAAGQSLFAEPDLTKESAASKLIIEQLELQAHVEGGYFRRTYQSDSAPQLDTQYGPRLAMSSIFYLLTSQSSVGHWHLNKSDIMHYFQGGAALTYYLIHPDGELEVVVMGSDLEASQKLQLMVPGGTWKASHLESGDYGLISEAVVPGFEYSDMTLGECQDLLEKFPLQTTIIERFCR